jgi:hypothetical protein
MLIPLPGSSHLFCHGGWQAVLEAMRSFLASASVADERRR